MIRVEIEEIPEAYESLEVGLLTHPGWGWVGLPGEGELRLVWW